MRGTGRTTRLVDEYVQKLYSTPNTAIEIRDHWQDNLGHRHLIERIKTRFRNEHPDDFMFLETLGNFKMMLRR